MAAAQANLLQPDATLVCCCIAPCPRQPNCVEIFLSPLLFLSSQQLVLY